MEDINSNLEQIVEMGDAQGDTPENGVGNADSMIVFSPCPILIDAEPMQEGTETNEDSLKGSLGKEALPNDAIVSIDNIDKIHAFTRKKSRVRRQTTIRGNRMLSRAMQPKNALMALNELKGIKIENFSISVDGGKSKAIVTVNGIQYVGHGSSKMSAKNAACEKAISDYMSYKLKAMPLDGGDELTSDPEDEKSILNLASFALHKLFEEWERKQLPIPTVLNVNVKAEKEDAVDGSELPNGWEKMHPVSLLFLMRPNISIMDVQPSDNLQKGLKCVRVTLGTRSFTANGRSKKVARRLVAIDACNTLFGTNFTEAEAT